MNKKYIIQEKQDKDFILNIKDYFNSSSNSIHKARNEIKLIDYEDKKLVIKSFKVPNIINKFVYSFFRDSKAKKSYDNSLKIIDFVPKPIGYIEFYDMGLLQNSYFVSENFDYDFDIRPSLIQDDFEDKENLFVQFARFTFELHEQNIYHQDFSPGNILIKKEAENYIFKIVDINRMSFYELSLEDRLRNFAKLWAKDKDLVVIIKEYAKLLGEDEQKCLVLALKYSNAHKNRINRKKRLRGQEIDD
jgi:serine/threonine protein kinase